MAISVKFKRDTVASANTFIVTAGSGDTGKLQIQYNSADIYNNLSGSTNNIVSGASNVTINIPTEDDGTIPQGIYYFNFVASVGSSDTSTVNFLTSELTPELTHETDVYSPTLNTADATSYTITNGSATSVSRTLSLIYPTGSNQTTLTASAAAVATDLEIETSNVWTGAYQSVLNYDLTYTITSTTASYDNYTYQEVGSGYEGWVVEADTLCSIYNCFENLRRQVVAAATGNRANYPTLLSNYTYMASLITQYREAVSCGNTAACDAIFSQIEYIGNCTGCGCTSNGSDAPQRISGLGGSTNTEEVQDIVGNLLTDAVKYGWNVAYSAQALTIDNDGIWMSVYNDTGSTLSKGKAVYISGYDTGLGLPEASLATNAAANSAAQSFGLVGSDIASAASGRCLVYGKYEGDTSSYSVGDRLYLSTSGNLTTTEPSGSTVYQYIGVVGKSDASTGIIHVTPSRAFDFNTIIDSSTVVDTLQTNFAEATASATSLSTLNTTGIAVVAGTAGRIVHLHSVDVYLQNIPSPSTAIVLQLFANSAAAYNTNGILMEAQIPVSATTGQYRMFIPQSALAGDMGSLGDTIYLGAASNEASWATNEVKLTAFYKRFTP